MQPRSRAVRRRSRIAQHHAARADCLAAGRAAAAVCSFDIALIDLELPEGDGTDRIRELADTDPVCVVTNVCSDDMQLFSALQAGAGGYRLKDLNVSSRAEAALEAGRRGLVC